MHRLAALALLGTLAAIRPAQASPEIGGPEAQVPDAQVSESLASLMAADARLQSIGWRLAHGNAAFCPDAPRAIGLLLLDAANFGDPQAIRTALGLHGDIAVDAVAAGSPADRAGLRPGQEVQEIDGDDLTKLQAVPAGNYTRIASLQDRIDAALASNGTITFKLRGQHKAITIAGEPACRARFAISSGDSIAGSDGQRVRLREGFLNQIADDNEAAASVAHELAHNIFRHPQLLKQSGRRAAAVRATETEADRLSPWLMANAGFDPEAAIRFGEWRKSRELPGIFRAPTHDGWEKRLASIREEVAAIAVARAAGVTGPLDWRSRFAAPLAASLRAPSTAK